LWSPIGPHKPVIFWLFVAYDIKLESVVLAWGGRSPHLVRINGHWATASAAAAATTAAERCLEKNTNPLYLTAHEIMHVRQKGDREGKWYFDALDRKADPLAHTNCAKMTNPAIITEWKKFGDFTAVCKTFK
jgi:hypothetical protein